jgi:hypothetical protein
MSKIQDIKQGDFQNLKKLAIFVNFKDEHTFIKLPRAGLSQFRFFPQVNRRSKLSPHLA